MFGGLTSVTGRLVFQSLERRFEPVDLTSETQKITLRRCQNLEASLGLSLKRHHRFEQASELSE
jgi:hypothetical protein